MDIDWSWPFSHLAGANLPEAIVAWASHGPVSADWFSVAPNVTGAKCDRLVRVNDC